MKKARFKKQEKTKNKQSNIKNNQEVKKKE